MFDLEAIKEAYNNMAIDDIGWILRPRNTADELTETTTSERLENLWTQAF